jgi:hypothetical protein
MMKSRVAEAARTTLGRELDADSEAFGDELFDALLNVASESDIDAFAAQLARSGVAVNRVEEESPPQASQGLGMPRFVSIKSDSDRAGLAMLLDEESEGDATRETLRGVRQSLQRARDPVSKAKSRRTARAPDVVLGFGDGGRLAVQAKSIQKIVDKAALQLLQRQGRIAYYVEMAGDVFFIASPSKKTATGRPTYTVYKSSFKIGNPRRYLSPLKINHRKRIAKSPAKSSSER